MSWRRHALPLVLTALLWGAGHAKAMNVAPAPIEALVAEAHLVVRGLVLTADSEQVPGRSGQFRTRHQLVIWEHLKAPRRAYEAWPTEALEILEIVQPGGRMGSLATVVPGVAPLRPGDEVVLLLVITPWGLQPLGYSQGTFFVAPQGALLPAWPGHRAPGSGLTIPAQLLQGQRL